MIKLSKWELSITLAIFLLQKAINPLYVIIPTILYYFYKTIIPSKESKDKIDIDEIIQKHFKNTLVNRNVYAVLLSNPDLIKLVKELEIFNNVEKGNYREIIYNLWAFLKAYSFGIKKTSMDEKSLLDIIEKRNKILNNINNLLYTITGDKSSEYIYELVTKMQYQLNTYIKLLKNKYNITISGIPMYDVSQKYTIF
jgi:hypothetical protein